MAHGNRIFNFSSPVVLVGGGEVCLSLIAKYAGIGWPIVCADGGANHLKSTGLSPAAIVGDLDSLDDKDYWRSRAELCELAEQDTTDFEKCLYSVNAPLYLACGFTGSRFDHTLSGLHVIQKFESTHRVILMAGDDLCFATSNSLRLRLQPDVRFSIYPLQRMRFKRSAGLKYALNGLTLEQGKMIGTSNQTTDHQIDIEVDSGTYTIILPKAFVPEVVHCLLGD